MFRVIIFLLALSVASGSAASEAEPWSEMPAGEGRRETFAICSACHSMKLVEQQGMTRAQWDETLKYMFDEQGMAQLEGILRARILDYLATAYPPDRPNWNPEN
jgi:hypothetical protein